CPPACASCSMRLIRRPCRRAPYQARSRSARPGAAEEVRARTRASRRRAARDGADSRWRERLRGRRRGRRLLAVAALRAVAEEGVLAHRAAAALVEQLEPAMDTEVGFHVAGGHHRALAARAHAGGELLQRLIVRQPLPTLGLALLLDALAALQIAAHRLDDVVAGDHGQHDADAVAHIAAVTR